jgi:hypothetical protein
MHTSVETEIEASPDAGCTHLTLVFEGRPVMLAARLLMPLGLLACGTLERQLASDLERKAERASISLNRSRPQNGGPAAHHVALRCSCMTFL